MHDDWRHYLHGGTKMSARTQPIFVGLSFSLLISVLFAGCGSSSSESDPPAANIPGRKAQPDTVSLVPGAEPVVVNAEALKRLTSRPEDSSANYDPYPIVVMSTNHGNIKIKLNREKAPLTVENFLDNYVSLRFYDETILHYVDKGYMIAGGGYTADLQLKTPRENIRNEAANGLKNKAGTICMARFLDATDSSNSQFIFNLKDNPELDHQSPNTAEEYGFCVFGEVIEGMEVLQTISDVAVVDKENFPMTPASPVIVQSVKRVASEGIDSASKSTERIK